MITFEGAANPTHNLSLCGSLKFKIFVRFAGPTNLITNLTYVEDFVKVLRAKLSGVIILMWLFAVVCEERLS